MKQESYIGVIALLSVAVVGLSLSNTHWADKAKTAELKLNKYEAAQKDAAGWIKFQREHGCKTVANIPGDFTITPVPVHNADGSTYVGASVSMGPDKAGWLCNDGVIYWR